ATRPPDFAVIRKIRDLTTVLKDGLKPKTVIFIAPLLALPIELQKDVTIVDFDLPTFEEIRSMLREMIAANSATGRISIELDADEEEKLAKAALGLTLQEAENAFARAMVRDGKLNIQDVEVILEE